MPVISAGDQTLLRELSQKADFFLTILQHQTLWSARINDGSITRGERSIAFDTGSGSDFALIEGYQELWIGTDVGDDDIGRVRIRSISSGDGGTTGTVTVAAHGYDLADDLYLTFQLFYPIGPKKPFIDSGGVFYKDSDITYAAAGNPNEDPYPVCICGPNRADFLESGSWVIDPGLDGSYTTAPGASLTNYTATVIPSAGSSVSITAGTGVGTITFTTAGARWVKYSVTDSNGQVQTSWRWYYAHERDRTSAHYPLTNFMVSGYTDNRNSGGKSGTIRMAHDADISDVPDKTIAIIWFEPTYGTTTGSVVTSLPDGSKNLLTGYVLFDKITQDRGTGSGRAEFRVVSAEAIDNEAYSYSMSLRMIQGTPSKWHEFTNDLTPQLAALHFIKWHSTLLETTDVLLDSPNSDLIAWAEFTAGTLYEMPNQFLQDRSIRQHLQTDQGGRIHIIPDIQLLPDTPRGALSVALELADDDLSGEIEWSRRPMKRAPYSYVDGLSYDGTFDANGDPTANPHCATAPGVDYYPEGNSPATLSRQTWADQTNANQVAGRLLSHANLRNLDIGLDFEKMWLPVLDTAYAEFWQMDILSTTTIREIVETDLKMILMSVNGTLDASRGVMHLSCTFEPEAPSLLGVETECPGFPDLGGIDFDPFPESELSGAVVTGGSVEYKPPQTKAWTQRSTDDVEDLVIDPFWVFRQDSIASADAIFWTCGTGFIKRTTNAGTSFTTKTPGDPPNTSGDSPAPTAANVTWIMGEASVFNQGEFIFIGIWQNSGGLWRTWVAHTTDDGDTWDQDAVSSGGGDTDQLYLFAGDYDMYAGRSNATKNAKMNSTDMAVVWSDYISIGPNNETKVVVGRTSEAPMTFSNTITLSPQAASGQPGQNCVTALSSTRLAVSYQTTSGIQVATLEYDASTQTLTLEENTLHATGHSSTNLVEILGIDSQKILLAVSGNSTDVDDTEIYHIACDSDGTNQTLSNQITLTDDTEAIFSLIKEGEGSTDVQIFYSEEGVDDLYGRRIDASSVDPAWNGSADLIISNARSNATGDEDPLRATWLGSGKALIIFTDDTSGYGYAVITNLSASLTGTAVQYAGTRVSNNANNNTSRHHDTIASNSDGTKVRVMYTEWSVSGATTPVWRDLTVSGYVITVGAEEDLDVAFGSTYVTSLGSASEWWASGGGGGGGGHILDWGSPGDQLKAQSITMAKGAGLGAYITAWNQAAECLDFLVWDIATDSILTSITLTPCSEVQLSSKTYAAYAYAPWGISDDEVFIYGRMLNPYDLGVSHVLFSDSAGLLATLVEGGFGSDHVGSFLTDFDSIYATRNTGRSPKLYVGTLSAGLSLASTSILRENVWPHGTFWDFFEEAIYMGSGSPNTIMVVKTQSPFLEWEDITYDHPTSGMIQSLGVLSDF